MMGMLCFVSSAAGPMPESMSSFGVSKEPAVRITSLVAWAGQSQSRCLKEEERSAGAAIDELDAYCASAGEENLCYK
jgi:hypothetical protein